MSASNSHSSLDPQLFPVSSFSKSIQQTSSSIGETSVASALPEKQLLSWAAVEAELFEATRKKFEELKAKGLSTELNSLIFSKFEKLCKEHKIHPDLGLFSGLLPSVRSALGQSSERLLHTYGVHAVSCGVEGFTHKPFTYTSLGAKHLSEGHFKPFCFSSTSTGPLLAYRTGSEFISEVRRLRKLLKNSSPSRSKEQALAKTLASSFFISNPAALNFITSSSKSVSYPDSVSVFEREIRIAQHKLSGETDTSNTSKNIENLIAQQNMFCKSPGATSGSGFVPVVPIVVVPHPANNVQARWVRGLASHFPKSSKKPPLFAVYLGKEIFRGLFGVTSNIDALYSQYTSLLSDVGSQRLFYSYAPTNWTSNGISGTIQPNASDV